MKQIFVILFLFVLSAAVFTGCNDDDDSSDEDSAEPDDDDDNDDDDNDDNNDDDNDDDTAQCWQDLPVGEKEIFAQGLTGTEGIAFSAQGVLYTSATNAVAKFDPQGNWETIGSFENPVGITFGPDDLLYVCDFGSSSLPSVVDGSIYTLSSDGVQTPVIEDAIANPNFITYTPWGTWLISDDFDERIFELASGSTVSDWYTPISSPNGMVFSKDLTALYVASTFTTGSPVYRVNLDLEGTPTSVDTIANLEPLSLLDGVALDENGMLYVAANGRGKIVRINPDTGALETVAQGLTTPASIAFGVGPDYDPCSIYVTELIGSKVWRISLGLHGQSLLFED